MKNNEFFFKKRDWSKIKDDLLSYYLKIYFTKLLSSNKDIVYIDAFAGKGKFDDGSAGSPIIAISIAEECRSISKVNNSKIEFYFIEKKFSKELKKIVYDKNIEVIEGNYEDNIEKILEDNYQKNLFIYIDPFGIKSLHFDKFYKMSPNNFNSIELLLNLNSFGFLREGARLLKYKEINEQFGIEERENDEEICLNKNDINNMNRVANGEYWKDILEQYNKSKIDIYKAEEMFVEQYKLELNKIFKYVLDIPIKANKLEHLPKYRMVFATNYTQGLIEMSINMRKRWNDIKMNISNNQIQLFDFDLNGKILEDRDYNSIIISSLTNLDIRYDFLLCKIIKNYGIQIDIVEVNKEIKNLEKENKIIITRSPVNTPTGKKANWINYKCSNKKSMHVRLNDE